MTVLGLLSFWLIVFAAKGRRQLTRRRRRSWSLKARRFDWNNLNGATRIDSHSEEQPQIIKPLFAVMSENRLNRVVRNNIVASTAKLLRLIAGFRVPLKWRQRRIQRPNDDETFATLSRRPNGVVQVIRFSPLVLPRPARPPRPPYTFENRPHCALSVALCYRDNNSAWISSSRRARLE